MLFLQQGGELVGGSACKTPEDYVTIAQTLDRVAAEVGVNFIASLPEGLIRPDNIPAIGSAPFTPGCQISNIASEIGSNRFNSNGRPFTNTSTIGLPAFFSSFASSS